MDVTEAVLPPGLASGIEESGVVVSGLGVLRVADEVCRNGNKLVPVPNANKGALVVVPDGIEAIAETLPRFINASPSQQEVSLLPS